MGSAFSKRQASAAVAIYSQVQSASNGHCVRIDVVDPASIAGYKAVYDDETPPELRSAGDAAIAAFDLTDWEASLPSPVRQARLS
jgi:hypothetical protein